ncbi:MAG: hypothetical protein ACKUBY_00565 [Candidatus Moraniibacteriota bacterium]|jgi:hypothetical protein
MLISLHLPKTAGSSFRKSLHDYFGNQLLIDHKDAPLQHSSLIRHGMTNIAYFNNYIFSNKYQNIQCIHGHFLPFKYLPIKFRKGEDVKFVTWMRNPVDRLISHYNYWQKSYNYNESFNLHKKVIEENWSLENFCFSNELRNVYSKYLWKFPLEDFDFIGITEFYEEDVKYFSKFFLKVEMSVYHERVNRKNSEDISDEFRKNVERFHAKDMQIYRKALELRAQRKNIKM